MTAFPSSTCGIRTDATLWCWGENGSAELGLGTRIASQAKPAQIDPAAGGVWAQMSDSSGTGCAVRTDGTLWCWGSNVDGQVGNGTIGGPLVKAPAQVGTASDWREVSVGSFNACAVTTGETMWCWGRLGLTIGSATGVPVRVGTRTGWQVVSDGSAACALHGEPTLWCWGPDNEGEVGNGATGGFYTSPMRVGSSPDWLGVSVSADNYACAVMRNRSAWCWGDDFYGQLGNGTTGGFATSPVKVS